MSIRNQSGITAQWHELITDAQASSGIQLDTPIESYLVHTLFKYTQRPAITARIFAMDHLLTQTKQGQVRNTQFRVPADQYFFYFGMFPAHYTSTNV